jgi:hypothetical protein
MFGVVSRNFVAACYPFQKRVSECIQSTSFYHRNHFSVFRNEHAQSTILGTKLMLEWFRAISLPHVTHSKNGNRGAYKAWVFYTENHFIVFRNEHSQSENGYRGAYKAWVWPPKPFLRFSQRTCPIHYFRSKTHVWGGFTQFRCCTPPIPKTGIDVHTKHEFLPPEPLLRFSERTCPIHYFRPKTHVWGGFAQFRCHTSPIPKTL